ncbi:MAG: hypothetical protein ACIALR_14850 [Blastopirellula sp. JB062]
MNPQELESLEAMEKAAASVHPKRFVQVTAEHLAMLCREARKAYPVAAAASKPPAVKS